MGALTLALGALGVLGALLAVASGADVAATATTAGGAGAASKCAADGGASSTMPALGEPLARRASFPP